MQRNKRTKGSKRFDLESEYGFRLMVPQRDFEPGSNIATNIANGMQGSRRIIFIISRLETYMHPNRHAEKDTCKKGIQYWCKRYEEK